MLGVVESVEDRDGLLVVRLSCLAMGSYFRAVYHPPEHPVSLQGQEFEDDEAESL